MPTCSVCRQRGIGSGMSAVPYTCHDGTPADARDELVGRVPALVGTLKTAGTNQTYARFESFWSSWATATALQGLLVMGIAASLAPPSVDASFTAWLLLRSGLPLAVLGGFAVFLVLSRRADPPTSTYIGQLGLARVIGEPPTSRVEVVLYSDIVHVEGRLQASSQGGVDYDWRFFDAHEAVRLQVRGHEPELSLTLNDAEEVVLVGAPHRSSPLLFAQHAERAWRENRPKSTSRAQGKHKGKQKKR